MEAPTLEALIRQGLNAVKPKTKGNNDRATGYPDLKILSGQQPIFIEMKTYNPTQRDTTFRSFYLSPSEDPKVHEEGYHLLVGFATSNIDSRYFVESFALLDLYGLPCDIKTELNSDNKRLYSRDRILIQGAFPNT